MPRAESCFSFGGRKFFTLDQRPGIRMHLALLLRINRASKREKNIVYKITAYADARRVSCIWILVGRCRCVKKKKTAIIAKFFRANANPDQSTRRRRVRSDNRSLVSLIAHLAKTATASNRHVASAALQNASPVSPLNFIRAIRYSIKFRLFTRRKLQDGR